VAGQLIAAPTGTDNVHTDAAGAPNFAVGGGFVENLTANPAAKGNSGYADVIYSSTASPAAFAPVTRRLFFPAAPFVVYGISSMPSGNANDWNYYSGNNGTPTAPARTNDIQTMAITADNFGTTLNPMPVAANSVPSSTVFVPPILVRGFQNNNTGTVTAQLITDAAATNPDMLVISGSSSFGRDVADLITNNFLRNDKTVLLCCEDVGTINAMFQSLVAAGYMTGNMYYNTQSGATYGSAPVYWFANVDDPIVNGPFMIDGGQTLRNYGYWGQDGNGASPYWFTDTAGIVSYSNAENQSNTTDPLPAGLPAGSTMGNGNTAWRFTRCPLVIVNDGGFLASNNPSNTDAPSLVDGTTKRPVGKTNYGSGGTRRTVYNSVFVANVTAWAIQRRTTR
jgi:hypothetical protein